MNKQEVEVKGTVYTERAITNAVSSMVREYNFEDMPFSQNNLMRLLKKCNSLAVCDAIGGVSALNWFYDEIGLAEAIEDEKESPLDELIKCLDDANVDRYLDIAALALQVLSYNFTKLLEDEGSIHSHDYDCKVVRLQKFTFPVRDKHINRYLGIVMAKLSHDRTENAEDILRDTDEFVSKLYGHDERHSEHNATDLFIGIKLARIKHGYEVEDSLVDIVGYILLFFILEERHDSCG